MDINFEKLNFFFRIKAGKFLHFLVFALLFLPLNAIVLNCVFADVAVRFTLRNVYSCKAQLIFIGDPRIVTEVIGVHSRSNEEVQSIEIVRQNVKVFPRNIEKFFTNLEAIYVHYSGLQEILRQDLRPFPKLRQVDLHLNDIKELNENLFEFNPLVEAVSVYSNPIRHVGHNIFDGLKSLHTIHIINAKCISERSDGNRSAVEEIMFKLSIDCPPTFEMIERKILSGNELATVLDDREAEIKIHVQSEMVKSSMNLGEILRKEIKEKLDKRELEVIAKLAEIGKRLSDVEGKIKSCVCVLC